MSLKAGFMVIVDISGYTTFVKAHSNPKKSAVLSTLIAKMNDGHGEHIISDLLETVINELEGTLTVNKLEGDAALFYAIPDNIGEFAPNLFKKLVTSIEIFNKRINELQLIQSCPCIPCNQIVNLKLKCFVHYGDFLIKKVNRFEEIAGEPVIILHRLMKNTITDNEYILLTQKAAEISNLDEQKEMEKRVEKIADFGKMPVFVHYPFERKTEIKKPSLLFKIKNFLPMQKYFWHRKTEKRLKVKLGLN